MSIKKQNASHLSQKEGSEAGRERKIGEQPRFIYFKKLFTSFFKGKNKSYKQQLIVPIVLISSLFFSGCGLIGGEKKSTKIDPPEDVTFVNEEEIKITEENNGLNMEGLGDGKEVSTDTVKTELYLLDKNGYVVPQTIALPKEEGIAKLALQSLVQNGPISNMLPSGFQAVLPSDTEVMGIDIQNGVAVVDFSKEFADYKPEDEQKIMQSIAWTLTQFETIDMVKLQINGHALDEMPANGTPIGEGLTRKIGINIDTSNMVDLTNTKPVTVYYIGQQGESYYYVPVTRRVSNKIENNIEAVVKQLIDGPSYSTNLLSDFLPDVALIDKPKVEDGKVILNFNEFIVGSVEKENVISEHVLTSLVLSLTEQQGIESVSIMVNGNDQLVNENGEKLSKPVTRPEKVNIKGL